MVTKEYQFQAFKDLRAATTYIFYFGCSVVLGLVVFSRSSGGNAADDLIIIGLFLGLASVLAAVAVFLVGAWTFLFGSALNKRYPDKSLNSRWSALAMAFAPLIIPLRDCMTT